MPAVKVQWRARTSWRAKLYKPALPKLVPVPDGMAKRLGNGIMLIPTALEVDVMIRKIPRGRISTLAEIRKRLAQWHNADVACPLVTGIFLRIVAEAAEEDRLAGKSEIAPYWRVVREDGKLIAKFPGGVERQSEHLRNEGHIVEHGRVLMEKMATPAA